MGKSSERLIERLAAAIERDEITKAEVKRRTGFSSSLLETYLRAESVPGLDAADRIASALGASLGDILTGAEPAVPPHLQDIVKILSHAPPPVLDAVRALLMGYAKGVELDPPPGSRASLPEHRDDLPQKRKQRGK